MTISAKRFQKSPAKCPAFSCHFLPSMPCVPAPCVVTTAFIAVSTFRVPKILAPDWKFVKWLSVDAAEFNSDFGLRYRVGLFDGCRGWVFECPVWVVNQKVAELYGVWILVTLAARARYGQVCMLQDNMQAVWNAINLRIRAGLWRQNRVLRAVVHQLRRSASIIHVVYVPSEFQPADPLSRIPEVTQRCIQKATH